MSAAGTGAVADRTAVRRDRTVGVLVFLVALSLRLPFVSGLPDHPDGVRLIRSLETYDLLDLSPHFPGYPVAVLLARALPVAGGLAWAILSAVAGALSCALLAALVRRSAGDRAAWAAGLVCAVLPFLALESLRVGTDVLVLPFLLGAFLLERNGRGFLAGLALGVGLGVRPSAFAWTAGLLLSRHRTAAIAGVATGVALWLLPTLAVVGPESYVSEGRWFVAGHFSTWGHVWGAMSAGEGTPDRGASMLSHWLLRPFEVFGSPAAAVALLAALSIGAGRAARGRNAWRGLLPMIGGATATAFWLVVAQNPENPRHVLPLVVVAIGLGVPELARLAGAPRARRWAFPTAALLLGSLTLSTIGAASRYRGSEPPAMRAARTIAADPRFDPLLDRIYAGSAAAYFDRVDGSWDVDRRRTGAAIVEDLLSLPVLPRRVWVTRAALAGSADAALPTGIRESRDPRVAAWGSEVELLVLDPSIGREVGRAGTE